MRFHTTELPGVLVVEAAPQADERGAFARAYDRREFAEHGLCSEWDRLCLASNRARGTLRGMHYQGAPYGEVKLVQCVSGALHDVVLDLRAGSPGYRRWVAVELTAGQFRGVYIPAGCAHGYLTLADETTVSYLISGEYRPEAQRGVRFDDPAFGIVWPAAARVVSARDRSFPPWGEEAR